MRAKRKPRVAAGKMSLEQIHENVCQFVLVCKEMVENARQMRVFNAMIMERQSLIAASSRPNTHWVSSSLGAHFD